MTNFEHIMDFFAGKKTYIVGFLMILLGLINGDNKMVLDGVGFITMRAAIAKI